MNRWLYRKHSKRWWFPKPLRKHLFARLRQKALSDCPAGELIIEVKYSSLNYKDALSATGNKGVTRKYPHTPGIDAAGVVVDFDDANAFAPAIRSSVTGFDLGMNTSGGFGQYISVPSRLGGKVPQGCHCATAWVMARRA